MNYQIEITISTTTVVGKKYPIYKNYFETGDAEFLRKNSDMFEFDINLSNADPAHYEYKFDVDSGSCELVSMRAVLK
ncbi:hypothetical protein G7074_15925 [Pedobacter sp. HDW13]|uniref:hypothetical protein n=1 Tax=Pedobacter sp. HDW13 TaxID=2714940 RepID=UPI00140BC761|nr:hypothetical protein [Pedobacter sp. HDW13]QIL40621.1 hypothetical protein G7074_15925 [Pedobacter sp. HDW13]